MKNCSNFYKMPIGVDHVALGDGGIYGSRNVRRKIMENVRTSSGAILIKKAQLNKSSTENVVASTFDVRWCKFVQLIV